MDLNPIYKKPFCLGLILFYFVSTGISQNIKSVYLAKGDSTKNMFILVAPDDSIKIKSFIFLIPGSFELPNDVLVQSNLPFYAAKRGVLTIIPLFETGIESFAIDDSTQTSLRQMLDYCIKTYDLKNLPFYLGGFSTGGTCAIKYAELSIKNDYSVKPKALFAIDPPLDYERYYNAAERNLRLMKGKYRNPELVYMVQKIQKKMNGTPQTALTNFYTMSPYSVNDTSQSAVKLLSKMPISIYVEPDIDWWLNNRAFDYNNINSVDGAAMVNELHLLGNLNARFITTIEKGFRMPSKQKHPHSWSILDPDELLNWFNSIDK